MIVYTFKPVYVVVLNIGVVYIASWQAAISPVVDDLILSLALYVGEKPLTSLSPWLNFRDLS